MIDWSNKSKSEIIQLKKQNFSHITVFIKSIHPFGYFALYRFYRSIVINKFGFVW